MAAVPPKRPPLSPGPGNPSYWIHARLKSIEDALDFLLAPQAQGADYEQHLEQVKEALAASRLLRPPEAATF